MSTNRCQQSVVTCAYGLQALSAGDVAAAEAHIASCPDCQDELASLRPVVDRFIAWPTDVLRPSTSLQDRLALRIAGETGKPPVPPPVERWSEPEWEGVAPGIECKVLASDTENHRVSMLVRLAPGASYPSHHHAGEEELYLLDGELWIDGRKLVPGATTTVRLEGVTSASGARLVAPVCSSPAPTIGFADHAGASLRGNEGFLGLVSRGGRVGGQFLLEGINVLHCRSNHRRRELDVSIGSDEVLARSHEM